MKLKRSFDNRLQDTLFYRIIVRFSQSLLFRRCRRRNKHPVRKNTSSLSDDDGDDDKDCIAGVDSSSGIGSPVIVHPPLPEPPGLRGQGHALVLPPAAAALAAGRRSPAVSPSPRKMRVTKAHRIEESSEKKPQLIV